MTENKGGEYYEEESEVDHGKGRPSLKTDWSELASLRS